MFCEYGCGQEAKFEMKNGKWCCSHHWNACPEVKKNRLGKKRSEESKKKMSESHKGKQPWNKGLKDIYSEESKRKMGKPRFASDNPFFGKKHTRESKEKMSLKRKGKTYEQIYNKETATKIINIRKDKSYDQIYGHERSLIIRSKQSKSMKCSDRIYKKITISYLNKRYSFFSKIEEMRYNPYNKKEIQVHCKNHNCKNSKEQNGWFTPTYIQLYERIRQIEKDYGNGGCYFYCCEECKGECPLYRLRSDPFQETTKSYTQSEYQQFRKFVLERDNYICQYCGEKADYVHHERPQKLEPFFALDPDLAWSVCKKCHYKYGHKNECNTGNLSNIVCK